MPSFRNQSAKKSLDDPLQRIILVGERAITLTIRKNPRATRLTLRIEPGGKALHLTAPIGIRRADIDDFLVRHQGWLETKLSKFSTDSRVLPGGTISLRGIVYRIEHTGSLRGITEAVSQAEPVIKVSGLEEHLGRRLSAFLKKEARNDIEPLVAAHALTIARPVKSITMKDTRSRWGSCSWNGALSFSWRIVMAPPFVIDYLAAHEVSHLQEMHHGPEFWRLCERLCPRTDEARRWLKVNGSQLHAIDFG